MRDMTWKHLVLGLAVFASGLFVMIDRSVAQTAGSPTGNADTGIASVQVATDTGGLFARQKQNKWFERVGLKPRESTTIALQFSSTMAGQTVSATPLDGGVLTLTNQGRIGRDGSLSLTYKAANGVGQYRIQVSQGDSVQILQFWVRDLGNPQNNPPVYLRS
jgi:hypothetical protein